MPQFICVFSLFGAAATQIGFVMAAKALAADGGGKAQGMLKLIRKEFDRGSMTSDFLFALVTSLVSGCLGAFALILLVLALSGPL